MSILVTGSSGHLGEALMRTIIASGANAEGVDRNVSAFTTHQGSITDRDFVRSRMRGKTVVYHTATLHKPHVKTHSYEQFIDTNVRATLILLEEALAVGATVIYTSTTSTFGDALRPDMNSPAAWITEEVKPIPRNIYGVTKLAAEDLCHLFQRKHGLNCMVLRTSRFFPEDDDDVGRRNAFAPENLKMNELLYRRVEIEDVVSAHLLAAEKAAEIGFRRFIISATSPFEHNQVSTLRRDLPSVLRKLYPDYEAIFERKGWKMFDGIDRVYSNEAAREILGWKPVYSFSYCLERLQDNEELTSKLAREVGSKGYHEQVFKEGPYPV